MDTVAWVLDQDLQDYSLRRWLGSKVYSKMDNVAWVLNQDFQDFQDYR